MNTRAEAERCAGGVKAGFGLVGVLTLIEIIYYSFELWKECHQQTSANEPAKAFLHAERAGNSSFPPHIVRRASRGITRSAKHHNVRFNDVDTEYLTNHCLEHVYNADATVVSACCAEAPFLTFGASDA